MMHPSFPRYMEDLIRRKKEWAVAFRSGLVTHGNHTNNYAESTMCILKDVVLNRYAWMPTKHVLRLTRRYMRLYFMDYQHLCLGLRQSLSMYQ